MYITSVEKYKVMSYVIKIFVILVIVFSVEYFADKYENEKEKEILRSRFGMYSKHIIEDDKFINPKMNSDTLFDIKKFCCDQNLDFSKITAIALLENDFNLTKFNINKIDVMEYAKVYKYINEMEEKNKMSNYFKSIEMILKDVKCFPVVVDDDGKYTYSYEDTFGSGRNYNGNYTHEGCDIMASENVSGIYPIVSVTGGVVENVGWLPKGGYRVGIRSESGGYYYYAHLQEGSIVVNERETIKSGQLLGYMGDTGYGSEGTKGKFPVHLHFGIYIKTDNIEELAVNPYYVLKYLEKSSRFD